MAAPWTCSKCTFINDEVGGENDECKMCAAPREDFLKEETDTAFGGCLRGGLNQSIQLGDLTAPARANRDDPDGNGSLAALGNMSFAAWESDRVSWTCKACTFRNEPRFLMCGACGMAEGTKAVEDELINLGLERMDLHSAHKFLTKAVQKQLDSEREDSLRHERAAELLQGQIEEDLEEEEAVYRNQNEEDFNARKHLETLELIQKAERIEHQDMLFIIEQWRAELQEQPDYQQEQEMKQQEELLNRLLKEWEDKEKELLQLKRRLDGRTARI